MSSVKTGISKLSTAAAKARERLANAPIELEQLLDKLTAEAANVVDLFRRWDDNLNGMVSKDEFRRAMPVLGLGFPKEVRA